MHFQFVIHSVTVPGVALFTFWHITQEYSFSQKIYLSITSLLMTVCSCIVHHYYWILTHDKCLAGSSISIFSLIALHDKQINRKMQYIFRRKKSSQVVYIIPNNRNQFFSFYIQRLSHLVKAFECVEEEKNYVKAYRYLTI